MVPWRRGQDICLSAARWSLLSFAPSILPGFWTSFQAPDFWLTRSRMGLQGRTRKQRRFVILRVFTPSLDFLDPPLDRNVFLGGLPWLSFPLAPVPESSSQVGPVWCGVQACTCRWCPALSITLLLFLSALPLQGQVFILQLFPPVLPLPPSLLQAHFISLSASPCLCQRQPSLDTAVCFLSSFLSLHLSLSLSSLACLLSSVCWSVRLFCHHPQRSLA